LSRTLTVQGRSETQTAQQVVDQIAPTVAALHLPPGYRIELGAEIEEAAEANAALGQYLPHAAVAMLILFVWQFGSFRKLALILAIIPFALIGVAPASSSTTPCCCSSASRRSWPLGGRRATRWWRLPCSACGRS
jgi:multidrug efflux pump subunit AcrB